MIKSYFLPLTPLIVLLFTGCREYYPKPKAYLRVDTVEKYQVVDGFSFARFETVEGAGFLPEQKNNGEIWANILYPAYSTQFYGAYCRFNKGEIGLNKLTDDFYRLLEHNMQDEEVFYALYENPDSALYAHIFYSDGMVASPVRFFITDSVCRYFSGAIYFYDFLPCELREPYIRFMSDEMTHLIETFSWK